MFFSFYSIFCLGSTKNEGHICNLHAKTQLLMYDKGGLSTKKNSSPEGKWRTVRKPGLDENSGFEWKNLYFQYQWPKRNSFQGYSSSNSIFMHIWDSLFLHSWKNIPIKKLLKKKTNWKKIKSCWKFVCFDKLCSDQLSWKKSWDGISRTGWTGASQI